MKELTAEFLLNQVHDRLKAGQIDGVLELAQKARELAQLEPNPGVAVRALLSIGACHRRDGRWEEALRIYRVCLQEAKQTKEMELMGNAYQSIAVTHGILNNIPAAIRSFQKSLACYDLVENKIDKMYTCVGLATAYELSDLYQQSIDYVLEGLEIAQEYNRSADVGVFNDKLGVLFGKLGDFDLAYQYFKKAEALFLQSDSRPGLIGTTMNLGIVAVNMGFHEKGIAHYHKALKMARDLSANKSELDILNNMGEAYKELGAYAEALDCFKTSLAIAEKLRDFRGQVHSLMGLGNVLSTGSLTDPTFDSPIVPLKMALERAGEKQGSVTAGLIHQSMAEHYGRIGQSQEAMKHYRIALELSRKVFADPNAKRIIREEARLFARKLARKNLVTERRSLELEKVNNALKEVNHFKTSIVSMASHDLKNPLSSIRALCRLLLEEEQLADTQRLAVERILNESSGMLELVSSLLENAALELGRQQPTFGLCNVSELVSASAFKMRMKAEVKHQMIQLDLDTKATAWADHRMVQVVIDNLVSNALKYSPERSLTLLRTYTQASQVVFEVLDQGPGFTADDRARMFNIFQKLSAKPTGNESAHGIGLATVKRMIDLLNGRIELAHASGWGSVFRVFLPGATVDQDLP